MTQSPSAPVFTSDSKPRRAPGPHDLGSLNHGIGFVRSPLALLEDATQKYGPIVRYGKGARCLHLLHHPKHVQQVLIDNNKNYEKSSPFGMMKFIFGRGLLFNEGPSWFSQRRLLQPSFQPKQFNQLGAGISDVIAAGVNRWPRLQTEVVDIEEEMVDLSYGIIGKLLFGADLSPDLRFVLDSTGTKFRFFMGNIPLTPQNRGYKGTFHRVNKAVYGLIEERRAAEHPGDDMLGIMIGVKDKDTGLGMSDLQLRDEIVTLLFSGFDTTSRTLSWVFHALAENSHVEEAVHEELERVLGGRNPGVEDLPNLPYLQKVVKETMRVFPALPIIGRRAKGDDVIDGYEIPAGSFLTISPYLAHRDPNFWEDPLRFDPERFSPENEPKIGKFDYYPFGGGPRQCIGKGIAMMTIPLAVATIAQQFRFVSSPNWKVEHDIKVSFQSRRGIRATREVRPSLN